MFKKIILLVLALAILKGNDASPKRKYGKSNKIFKLYNSDEEFGGNQDEAKCGYDSCPKTEPNMVNVHLVPHTHDDVGWLKTVDQYYYGNKGVIQKAGVQYILDSVVRELLGDPKKKFIYVESAFFFKWWKEQTAELQDQVKMLVNEGRLEFIGGAWSMNDEATVHYHSVIDQFTWGLHLLKKTFGECAVPKIGWQIDPFGHTREMASLFTQMGFDGLFFGRLDFQDKMHRVGTKTMEMIWYNSENLEDNELFTGALYNHYSPPPGFCFDYLCNDEPIIDDKDSTDYNVDIKIDRFFDFVMEMLKSFRTNNLILTMGEDFHYQDANMWYKNLDKLIKYSNERQVTNGSKINVFYSTPSCYLKALHDSDITWPTKGDDFMPYASDQHSFWTGYFTSRPTIKRMERVGNNFLQVAKQLTALAPRKENYFNEHLNLLREAMGIMQHHDAVTGTEKQHVADDYAYLLHKAFVTSGANVKSSLTQLHGEKLLEDLKESPFQTCFYLNISSCTITETSKQFMVTLYNPRAQISYEYVRLPVTGNKYIVKDFEGKELTTQIVPVPESVVALSYRKSVAPFELVFLASQLPPLGYKSYFVTKAVESFDDFIDEMPKPNDSLYEHEPKAEGRLTIGNKFLTAGFDDNGLLTSVTVNGISSRVRQNFLYYEGFNGNNYEAKNRSSGAYIFRPNGTEQIIAEKIEIKVVRGPLVEEVHQIFNEWVSQVIRIYSDENHVELEWMVGPIPYKDNVGREIISRFYAPIASKGTFYTDSNGREMIKRVRNHRDTWELHLMENVSGNYYPVTSKIAVQSDVIRMAVLNDRAQGGTSMEDGVMELMVHRRLLRDDAFGVGEALNETAFGNGLVSRGKHYFMYGHRRTVNPTLEARERFMQNKVMLPAWTFISDLTYQNIEELQTKLNNSYSAATMALPPNVNLLTLEPWVDDSVLIRFEHLMDKDEDETYSKSVTFDLVDVFQGHDIKDVKETTLSANQLKSEAKRLKFRSENEYLTFKPTAENQEVVSGNNLEPKYPKFRKIPKLKFEIELHPMQIRTFIVQWTKTPKH